MSAAARVAAPPVASSRRRVPRAGAADPAGRRPTPVASLIMRRRLAPRLHVAARASNGASSSSSSSTDDVASGYDDARPSIRDLEELLATAIRDEDFTAAASLRDRLSAMKRDAATGVLDANERFYVAFRSGSLRAMRDVWGAGDHVQCMHPGSAVISGAPDVLASWEIVFSSIPGGGLDVEAENVRVHASGDLGFVTCVEKVDSSTGYGTLTATNVFERQGGEWKMVHHHANGVQGLL